jgi:hypothetical protein
MKNDIKIPTPLLRAHRALDSFLEPIAMGMFLVIRPFWRAHCDARRRRMAQPKAEERRAAE